MIFSFSRLKTFGQCPAFFRAKYLEGKMEKVSPAAERGKRVHAGVERILGGGAPEEHIGKQAESVLDFAGIRLPGVPRAGRRVRRAGGVEHSTVKAGNVLMAVEQKIAIDAAGAVVPFEDETAAVFRGVVDCVVARSSSWASASELEVYDWKTGTSSGDARQMEAYLLLVYLFYGVRNVSGYFGYLDQTRLSKPYKVPRYLDVLHRILADIARAEAEREWSPNPGFYCRWCPELETCPATRKQEKPAPMGGLEEMKGLF